MYTVPSSAWLFISSLITDYPVTLLDWILKSEEFVGVLIVLPAEKSFNSKDEEPVQHPLPIVTDCRILGGATIYSAGIQG